MNTLLNKEDYQTILRAVVLMVIYRKSNEICLINGERDSDLYIDCATDLGFSTINKESTSVLGFWFNTKALPITGTNEALKIDAALIAYNKSQIDKLINLIFKVENNCYINNFSLEEINIMRKALHEYQKDLDPVIYYSGIDQLSYKNSHYVVTSLGPIMDRIFDKNKETCYMFYDKVVLAEEKKRIPFLINYLNKLLPAYYDKVCNIGNDLWKYPKKRKKIVQESHLKN